MAGPLNRGEVRWYPFPEPDKRRPVVVLTRDSALPYLGEVTVAPITTRIRGLPTEVRLGLDDGLPADCVVNLDHVATVPAGRLGPVVAVLTDAKLARLRNALLFALGFDGALPIGVAEDEAAYPAV
jgi:mRNA interferase MazF